MNITNSFKFKELLSMVEHPDSSMRLPRAPRIRKSNMEIFFTEKIFGATVTIYRKGYIIYSRDGYETVSTVDRCASPTYLFVASSKEQIEGNGVAGCHSRIRNKLLYSIVPEDIFLEYPWYVPVVIICETRLANNQESREARHVAFYLDNEKYGKDYRLCSPSIEEELGLNAPDFTISGQESVNMKMMKAL